MFQAAGAGKAVLEEQRFICSRLGGSTLEHPISLKVFRYSTPNLVAKRCPHKLL